MDNLIAITPEQFALLSQWARQTGKTQAELLEAALRSFDPETAVEATPADGTTFYDRLNSAGLIGCIKEAPVDLSTNLQHMEGFGK